MNLETNKWKRFYIRNLFECMQSKGDNQAKDLEEGQIPLVSAGSLNNGIVKYIEEGDGVAEIFEAGCITADMFGKCFYQPFDFYAVSHGRINILRPKHKEINERVSLFLINVMEHEFRLKYSYNRMLSLEKLLKESICLPCGCNGNPDWNYMEKYIDYLYNTSVNNQIERIIKISNNDRNTIQNISGKINAEDFNSWANIKEQDPVDLNTVNWKTFKIGKLFTTYTGGDLILGNVEEGDIPVVTHSAKNNSISVYTNEISGRKLFDHRNTISLADRGTFFATIQPEDFYIGTRVKALESKNSDITKKALMFIASIINLESFRFNYGRNCTGGLDNLTIKLPAQMSGAKYILDKDCKYSSKGFIPDWRFMNLYIDALPYSLKIIN